MIIPEMDLLDLGISQLYLCERKIRGVMGWFDPSQAAAYAPLPVRNFGSGRFTLTDGHSRAYVAYKQGVKRLLVVQDEEEIVTGETGQKLYRQDIFWCERFSLRTIGNLENRILSQTDYQRLWIDRCDRGYNHLFLCGTDRRREMENRFPTLFLYGCDREARRFYFEDRQETRYQFDGGGLSPELP